MDINDKSLENQLAMVQFDLELRRRVVRRLEEKEARLMREMRDRDIKAINPEWREGMPLAWVDELEAMGWWISNKGANFWLCGVLRGKDWYITREVTSRNFPNFPHTYETIAAMRQAYLDKVAESE